MEEPITYTKVPVPADVKYGIEITVDGYEFFMADGGFLRYIICKKDMKPEAIIVETEFLVEAYGAVILSHYHVAKHQPTKTVTMVDDCCEDIPPLPLPFDGCKKLPMAEMKLIDENGRQLGSPIIELDEDGKIIGRKLK